MQGTNTINFPYLEQALQLNQTLLGLPILLLIAIGCVGLACLLFAVPNFPNRWIPAAAIFWGVLLNIMATPLTNVLNFVRAILLGLIVGVVSWVIFKKFGQKWIDPKLFQQNGDTEHLTKP